MTAEKSKLIAFMLSPRWSEGWHPRRLATCAVLCLNIPGRCESYVSRHVSVALFIFWLAGYCCHILLKVEFSRQIFDTQPSNFMKIGPVVAELFHAGGRTERHMTKLIAAFLRFHQRA